MENFYFMRGVLNLLGQAKFFNRMVATALRVMAVLIVPVSLVEFFKAGKVIFELPPTGILGGILFQMFFVVAIYAVVHALFVRAKDIEGITAVEFSMFPLAGLLFKAIGEAFAAFVSLVAVGGGLFVWFTGKGVATILNPLPKFFPAFGDTTFVGGIEFMVGGVFVAIAALILAYLLSEGMALLTEATRKVTPSQRSVEPPIKFRSGT